jgi:kynurenine formamidase
VDDVRRSAAAARPERATLLAAFALVCGCGMTGSLPIVSPSPPVFPDEWRVVDLTRPLDRRAPFLPHPEAFPFERMEFKGPRAGGWRTGAYSALEHMGTHVSAPLARLPAGASVDALPPESLVAPLVVLDLPPSAAEGGVVTAEDVLADERERGPIPPGAVVLLRTGRGAMAPDDEALLGPRPDGTYAFPGWGDDAVRLLAFERRVNAIGTDAIAVDSGANAARAPAETAGSAAGVYFLAGLGDLSRVPRRGAVVVVGVQPVAGAAGAGARVLALVPPDRP